MSALADLPKSASLSARVSHLCILVMTMQSILGKPLVAIRYFAKICRPARSFLF